jgi:hypothetical protein
MERKGGIDGMAKGLGQLKGLLVVVVDGFLSFCCSYDYDEVEGELTLRRE